MTSSWSLISHLCHLPVHPSSLLSSPISIKASLASPIFISLLKSLISHLSRLVSHLPSFSSLINHLSSLFFFSHHSSFISLISPLIASLISHVARQKTIQRHKEEMREIASPYATCVFVVFVAPRTPLQNPLMYIPCGVVLLLGRDWCRRLLRVVGCGWCVVPSGRTLFEFARG